MNLKDYQRLVHPDACFVCKWAGNDIAVWPQYLEEQNRWRIYLGVNEFIQGLRSGHRSSFVCNEHSYAVVRAWVEVAMDEVWLDYIWNQWIERTEQ